MDSVLVIENEGRRLQIGAVWFLIIFWLIWTPATLFVTYLAITEFNWFFPIWLIGGYAGVLGIPWWCWHCYQPQVLTVTDDSLKVGGSGNPFRKTKRLGLTEPLMLHFGRFNDESVVTLNLFYDDGFREHNRIMLAPMLHWEEQYQTMKEVEAFLNAHQIDLTVRDEMTIADV